MQHTISLLIENEAGALSRVVGLFSARGYNIESLAVAPTQDVTLSRLTLVTRGSERVIEQITKQLNKLIEVVKVLDLEQGNATERELMLIKLRAQGAAREEFKRLADIFEAKIIDVTPACYTIQLVDVSNKLDAFIEAVEPSAIMEVARSGVIGLARGERTLQI